MDDILFINQKSHPLFVFFIPQFPHNPAPSKPAHNFFVHIYNRERQEPKTHKSKVVIFCLSKGIAMASSSSLERSKQLHNFSLPCLKWGDERLLRCIKVIDDTNDQQQQQGFQSKPTNLVSYKNHKTSPIQVNNCMCIVYIF